MANRIQIRRDTAANWTAANPVLAQGEEGYETDTGKMKIGDGVTAWASLAYAFTTVFPPSKDSAQITAVAHATNIAVTVSSNWGINAQGNGYHDPNGAASAEGATIGFDTNGNLTLTRILAY